MTLIELAFPVLGRHLPEDNAYLLYSAISKALEGHLPDEVGVSSITGSPAGDWRLRIERTTRLRIRLSADRISGLLSLAGQSLEVGGHVITLGIPRVHALQPAPTLQSRLVTIKGFLEPEPFLEAARRQLGALGVTGQATIPFITASPRQGQPKRRVIRIKERVIVGFALRVERLSTADSLMLLTRGLGGRRHMGCGIFVPAREREGGTGHEV